MMAHKNYCMERGFLFLSIIYPLGTGTFFRGSGALCIVEMIVFIFLVIVAVSVF